MKIKYQLPNLQNKDGLDKIINYANSLALHFDEVTTEVEIDNDFDNNDIAKIKINVYGENIITLTLYFDEFNEVANKEYKVDFIQSWLDYSADLEKALWRLINAFRTLDLENLEEE